MTSSSGLNFNEKAPRNLRSLELYSGVKLEPARALGVLVAPGRLVTTAHKGLFCAWSEVPSCLHCCVY